MRICPCKNCTDRVLACHASCERYAQWRAELDELNKRRLVDQDIAYYEVNRNMKRNKRRSIK